MHFNRLDIPQALEIVPQILKDNRGAFVKTFHDELYQAQGIDALDFKEEYFSVSYQNVLRGLHFHLPPYDHAKLVYCIRGEVRDILFDMRHGSPMYGEAISIDLTEKKHNVLYVPSGVAHGFLTLSDQAMMVYKTTTVHQPQYDYGIHWTSCRELWRINQEPIISDRDKTHELFDEFQSPFNFETHDV
ncbi:MAG: dTDP-4-dehydrorhamnose 3,5-epimerase family protein [Legionellaceae bacterium]|nr:dTDP-4-dehydrorhamnose 3,5-epimerase family protein [Legionellaceae bacterium]